MNIMENKGSKWQVVGYYFSAVCKSEVFIIKTQLKDSFKWWTDDCLKQLTLCRPL